MQPEDHGGCSPKPAGDQEERARFAREVLTYFYPVHYRLGMEMERAMSQGRLDRKQAAMLWLIHSQATDGWVRRKEIEAELFSWFEMSSSKITRMIAELSRGEGKLIEAIEAPDSGREKMLRLTSEGQVFIDGMIAAASVLLADAMQHVSLGEQRAGLMFLDRAFRDFKRT